MPLITIIAIHTKSKAQFRYFKFHMSGHVVMGSKHAISRSWRKSTSTYPSLKWRWNATNYWKGLQTLEFKALQVNLFVVYYLWNTRVFVFNSFAAPVNELRNESLRWRHNGRDSVSYHQPYGCLLNRLFRRRWKKISKLRVTGLRAGNSPGTGEFPAQMASNAENVSIWWRHHDWKYVTMKPYRLFPCTIRAVVFKKGNLSR